MSLELSSKKLLKLDHPLKQQSHPMHIIYNICMLQQESIQIQQQISQAFEPSQTVNILINQQTNQSITLYRQDYESLLPHRWLRTQAVDLLIKLILQRQIKQLMKIQVSKSIVQIENFRQYIKVIDAFIVTLIMTNEEEYILESLQPLKLFSSLTRYLLIPINTEYCSGNHWLLGLLITQNHNFTLMIFDSGSNSKIGKELCCRLQFLYKILMKEQISIKLCFAEGLLYQTNHFDCGIYTIGYSEYIIKQIISQLQQEKSTVSFSSLSTKYRYLLSNSTHTRQRYRRMVEQEILITK